MIHAEFRKQTYASTRYWEHVLHIDLDQVPAVGELVNLAGNPYIVIRRAWAYGSCGEQYSYVYVLPAGNEGT